MSEVFVARQPIFDAGMRVVGYELLFRQERAVEAPVPDGVMATATVALNALTEIGLDRIVGSHTAWINLPRKFLLSGIAATLPPTSIGFEILEGELIDDELVTTVGELKRQGYRFALDDFQYTAVAEPLLAIVDIVKLDLRALGPDGFSKQVARLRNYDVSVLAEKVESHEEHSYCLQLGCDLFQGFFYCRPEILSRRRIDPTRISILQVISAVQDPTLQFEEFEQLISRDLGLSLRLLRYINSAFFGIPHEVTSVRRALALLGLENLRRWVTLTIFAGIDGKPSELTATSLIRARFCELAGTSTGHDGAQLFTVGLFSLVDALMDAPIEDVLDSVPFPTDMRQALITHHGDMGRLLDSVAALEQGDFGRAEALVPGAGDLFLQSITWANDAGTPLFESVAAVSRSSTKHEPGPPGDG